MQNFPAKISMYNCSIKSASPLSPNKKWRSLRKIDRIKLSKWHFYPAKKQWAYKWETKDKKTRKNE